MTSASDSLAVAGHGAPGQVGAIAGSGDGAVTSVRPSDRAGHKAPPLRSAHSQRDDGARVFSREWRALGDAAPKPKHKSGPKAHTPGNPPPNKVREHEVEWVHYARPGETLSIVVCVCDWRCEIDDLILAVGHQRLYDAYSDHIHPPHPRRKRGPHGELIAEVPMAL